MMLPPPGAENKSKRQASFTVFASKDGRHMAAFLFRNLVENTRKPGTVSITHMFEP